MKLGRGFRVGDVRCGFMLNEQEDCCNKPGVAHFQFTDDDTGVACEEHSAFARVSAIDEHAVGPDCTMPGAIWQTYNEVAGEGETSFRWSTCIFPLEHGLTSAVDVALPEPALAGA